MRPSPNVTKTKSRTTGRPPAIREFAIKMLGKDAGRRAFAEAASAASKFAETAFYVQAFITFNDAVNAAQQAKKACMEY